MLCKTSHSITARPQIQEHQNRYAILLHFTSLSSGYYNLAGINIAAFKQSVIDYSLFSVYLSFPSTANQSVVIALTWLSVFAVTTTPFALLPIALA